MSVMFSTDAGRATGSGDVDGFAMQYKKKFGSEPDASIIQQFEAAMAESGKALDDYGFEGDLNSRLSQKNALRDQLFQSQLDQYGLEEINVSGPDIFTQVPPDAEPAAQTNDQIMQSPEYQDALQRFQDSQGQDAEAKATLDNFQSQISANAGDQATTSTGPAPSDSPYVSGVNSTQTSMDPITQQLLYGLDGQGGFIPGAMQAANRTFFDEQGRPIVIPQEIAGFNQDQLAAMNLARSNVGSQLPFLQQSEAEMRAGLGALDRGQAQQLGSQGQSLRELQRGSGQSDFQSRLGLRDALRGNDINEAISRGATSRFGRSLGGLDSLSRGAVDQFGNMTQGATDNLSTGVSALGSGLERSLGSERGFLGDLRSGLSGATDTLGSAGKRLGSGLSGATDTLSTAEERLGDELYGAIGAERGAVDRFGRESAQATGSLAGSVDRFGNRIDDVEQFGIGALGNFTGDLGESQELLRGTTNQSFDPSSINNFYNPYEDAVVSQTIQDATKGLSQADMQEFASNVARGGESAFGSRARLGASERAEAVGRGLAKEVGGIRAAGFQNAQTAAMNEFQRQQDAQRQGATGLASLSGQKLGASERLSGLLGSGAGQRLGAEQSLSGQLSSDAAQRLQAERSIADRLSAAGSQRFGAGQSLASMMGNQASQQFGADQALASMMGNQASQLGAAGQSLSRRIGDVAQTNFGANQAMTNQQMAQAQGMLGANQNMNTQLRNSASQNLAAQQQLGNTMANMGQASSNARNMYGQNTMANAQAVSQGYGQLGNVQNQIGQQQLQAQQNYGGFLQNLGGQVSNANNQDTNTLMNMGNMQQGLTQQQLDAQRAGLLQAQQAPLAQYQSLMPFMQLGAGAGGSSQISTNYSPTPSALQAGLATGLGTLGAVGNFVGQTSGNNQPSQYYYPQPTGT